MLIGHVRETGRGLSLSRLRDEGARQIAHAMKLILREGGRCAGKGYAACDGVIVSTA